jgi:catechol 2,3-dioxygenase-like lactoylglutathione lyase family enzyme
MNNYPRTFSHIGISVPDVEKAVKFYSEVMGLRVYGQLLVPCAR